MDLALEMVERFHSKKIASDAFNEFELRFKNKQIPDNLETKKIIADNLQISNILKLLEMVTSTSEAIRLISQGGVKINGVKIIIIQVNNSEKFINEEESKIRKKLMKFNVSNYGSPFNISASTMNLSYNELYKLLKENLIKYKNIA